MSWHIDARITDRNIEITLTSDTSIQDPVFCFSLMAPGIVVAGGEMVESTGGYCEVRLPDLKPGIAHPVIVAYAEKDYVPSNRAWLPLGPTVRHAGGVDELPPLPSGVRKSMPGHSPAYDGLRLVPAPVTWSPHPGTLKLGALLTDAPAIARADALAQRLGLETLVDQAGTPCPTTLDRSLPGAGYRIEIDRSSINISAADDEGVFYAAISLLMLRAVYEGEIPCGTIVDHPQFGWRGMHLDCARHFFEPTTLHRFLDLMALCKLNRFHWHFSDDEAFRLEIDSYPEIWQKTAFRGQGQAIPGVFGAGLRSGGTYSKKNIADVVARASSLGIEILPEIEFPAHAKALNLVHPKMRDPKDAGTEQSVQGYRHNVVNPAMPETWTVIEAVASDVIGLFPFPMLHLGCDELPSGAWDGSPAVNQLKTDMNLKTRDDVQGWAMDRLAGHVNSLGVRPAAWEEAARGANGGIGHDALLFCWTGTSPGAELARAGYDVVMCPAQHVYLDMAHTSDGDDWGASWAAFIELEDTINWQPLPDDPDLSDRIIGVQGTFWSEFTTEDHQIEPMIAPRVLGVAQMAWNSDHGKSGTDFRSLAMSVAPLFDKIGWNWHRGA